MLIALLFTLSMQTQLRERIVPALIVTVTFACAAWLIGGVTLSGASAGFVATSVFFMAGGLAIFGGVLTLFAVTYAATKLGGTRKRSLGIAERSSGRDGAQVIANVGVAAVFAALAHLTGWRSALICGSIAALAEAACDTVSSEAGKALACTPRLITSWKTVAAGTDGAVSVPGTVLGIVAALAVVAEAASAHFLTVRLGILAIISSVLGMLFDSLLGATLERRHWLTNNGVNLLSTTFSATMAAALAFGLGNSP